MYRVVVALLSMWALAACHEGHNVDLIPASELEGGAGQGGGDGDGDDAGDGDGDDTGDGDGDDADSCDPEDCDMPNPLLNNLGGGTDRCCTDDGKCGALLDGFCAQYDFPGEADPDCPAQTIGFFPVMGCCRADGVCGIDATAVGLGCSMSPDGPNDVTCGD